MKRNLLLFSTILILAALFSSCSAGLTASAIEGEWFCQLGEDDGLLENEYIFDLRADNSYKFTFILKALGITGTGSGYEVGTWAYDEASQTLALTPDSGDKYSFEIQTLTYPKTRLKWKDLDNKLETISGVEEGQDGIFTFDLQIEE